MFQGELKKGPDPMEASLAGEGLAPFSDTTNNPQTELCVLICTQNRLESLHLTLQLLAENDIERRRFEVIVIDNAIEPTAKQVTESMVDKLSVRYLHEPREGKSYALNRGLEADCNAPIIAVLDDDMSPGPGWCRGVLELCERWPNAGVFAASSYVIWPENETIPDWIRSRRLSGIFLSVIDYRKERLTAPGEFMSGNYFWFRRSVVGARRFPDFWTSQAHFVLGLIDDGTEGVVAPEPRCGHRIQSDLLRLDVLRKRATLFGSEVSNFILAFPRTVPQAKLAANHPILWKMRCFAALTYSLLMAVSVPFRNSKNRIPTALLARVGITNHLTSLLRRS